MAKRTNKFGMVYFEQDDITNAQFELQRWETLDAQLESLFRVLGNGTLDGWNISSVSKGGLQCSISPGSGHVGFVAVESITDVIIPLAPNSINFVYAQLTSDSYYTKNVSFVSFVDRGNADIEENNLLLGVVYTDFNGVTLIDQSGKTELGFISLVNNAISAHKHDGSEGNPDPVDLSSEVQGVIGQENLPDLDASKILSGILDSDRLPEIDHITQLKNQGILTHAQLDSYVEGLSVDNQSLMGEVSTTNLLELILALKHVYPDIDEFLVNEIAFIPGISPDSYIDEINTTALVDTRTYAEGGEHTISSLPSEGFKSYTRSWLKTSDFLDNSGLNNVIVSGGKVVLETFSNSLSLDEFNEIQDWNVFAQNLSSISSQLSIDEENFITSPSSAKLIVGSESVEVQLLVEKIFNAEDWSDYDFITFYIYTENIRHGDLFFYFRDAVYGEQNSSILVLKRNAPTINQDTLRNGWQEVSVDLRPFKKENVDTIGFYVSTQDGWDTSEGFDFNIDSIQLTSGNAYQPSGYIRLEYGTDLLVNFETLRWDSFIPSDDLSSGVALQARTRIANTSSDLQNAPWSSYNSVSGSSIDLPVDSLYKFIEIEMFFSSSTTGKRSALLDSVYLDYSVVDLENSFEFNSQADWENGTTYNIDTKIEAGSISIKDIGDYNNILYGVDGGVYQIDSDFEDVYKIVGSVLPRSTYQILNGLPSGFGLIAASERGNDGSVWLADVDNDRVLELNKAGEIVNGFLGSFLSPPSDFYGREDLGPGSNVPIPLEEQLVLGEESTAEESDGENKDNEAFDFSLNEEDQSSEEGIPELNVLQSLYNPQKGILYVVFSNDLENIYRNDSSFNINGFSLKAGGYKVWLYESDVSLFNIPEEKYLIWESAYKDNLQYEWTTEDFDLIQEGLRNLKQFNFKSHILQFEVKGSERSFLNSLVDAKDPTITIVSPYQQQKLSGQNIAKFIVSNCNIGDQEEDSSILVTLDGVEQTIISDSFDLGYLSNGTHSLQVKLVQSDNSFYDNPGAQASVDFVVDDTDYILPYLSLISPKPNQVYSSSPFLFEFEVENFPIISSGQHIRYQIDDGLIEDYYSTDPILIEGVSHGKHEVTIWIVDEKGNKLDYEFGEVNGSFIVGKNLNASLILQVSSNAISDGDGGTLKAQNTYVDVENLSFSNIYSPFDLQVIPSEASINHDGTPSILISKLRSLSGLEYLSGQSALDEIFNRALLDGQVEVGAETEGEETSTSVELNPSFSGTETTSLLYSRKYLDGHSVVQLNMDGGVIFSNNAAIFSDSKESAKKILGSAKKIGDSELLIGDSIYQRAMVIYTNLETQSPNIVWEYQSDRYVVDFDLNLQDEREIIIYDGSISEGLLYVRQGMNVIWKNESSSPISIYSGLTNYELFQVNPNLNLYGETFKSPVMQPGDVYSFKFNDTGIYPWFVYPSIINGSVQVNQQRLSNQDEYYILESDGLKSPFSSRLIKVDSWGNVVWSFGEGYLVQPRDIQPLLNKRVLIST